MNLLLLHPEDFEAPPSRGQEQRARVTGRRLEHVLRVHRAGVGDELRVGLVGGAIGQGRVLELSPRELALAVRLDRDPPPARDLTLVVALPRPLVLKRVLLHATTLGVKRIALIHSRRVEKSYWQSEALTGETLSRQLLLGLEQAGDTVLPDLSLHRRFRPFVEDELSGLLMGRQGFLPDPAATRECPRAVSGPVLLAIGPEGGFIPWEVEKLGQAGLQLVHLGARVLRVEAAVPFAIARLG